METAVMERRSAVVPNVHKEYATGGTSVRQNKTFGWIDKWEKLPQTPQSYNPKEEYIRHLEEKYESLR
ncbi:hypothetical protein AGMMS49965_04590 [Bacteroidia bacterium]|nr:hypothetical protein AGMMS49965_04590 [Bacteroidia bacterium]